MSTITIPQLIPSDVCLRCDVCCRFAEKDTPWAPVCTESETNALTEKKHATQETFCNKINKSSRHIRLVAYRDYYACPYFTESDHACRVYSMRPFECQLYPFLLIKQAGKFFLGYDVQCPFLDAMPKEKLHEHLRSLQQFFQKPEAQSFLVKNDDLFTEYANADIEIAFPMELCGL